MKKRDWQFFQGIINLSLGEEICQNLRIQPEQVEISRFADGECRVWIPQIVEREVFVFQSFQSSEIDQNLMEAFLLIRGLKEKGVKKIIVVLPYFPYGRQDKAHRLGETVSAKLVADFLKEAGADGLITCDLHSQKLLPFFKFPVVNLSANPLFADYFKKEGFSQKETVVASPDQGGKMRAADLAKLLSLSLVVIKKERNKKTGEIQIMGIEEGEDKIKGKTALILDDMIAGGGTLIKSAKMLKEKGAAEIFAFATHGLLLGSAPQILESSEIQKIVITNSLPISKKQAFKKLEILSLASLLTSSITLELHQPPEWVR